MSFKSIITSYTYQRYLQNCSAPKERRNTRFPLPTLLYVYKQFYFNFLLNKDLIEVLIDTIVMRQSHYVDQFYSVHLCFTYLYSFILYSILYIGIIFYLYNYVIISIKNKTRRQVPSRNINEQTESKDQGLISKFVFLVLVEQTKGT